jgi:septal ring factor EnvC (AmiA/AmiB activator)
MSCKHALVSDFKRDGLWLCSGCGNASKWTANHTYYGSMGCTKCHEEPVIQFVACSDACMAMLDTSKSKRQVNDLREKSERLSRRQHRRQQKIQRLEAELAALKRQQGEKTV